MEKNKNNKVQIVKAECYLDHLVSIAHPECPERLEAIYTSLLELERIVSLSFLQPRSATKEEVGLIHHMAYIQEIEHINRFPTYLDADTPITKGSYKAALCAAGGLLESVDSVFSGNTSPVFALIRPPGHHAERSMAKGFCLFNNVAIAARYAQKNFGIKRVLICDWDVHHGNGTQHAFYDDPSVLYFSIHQYPHYPGTGAINEIGISEGEGFTINCPLPPGQGDAEYKALFQHILIPIALQFSPELILVSAGFDPYMYDPLAQMNISEDGFTFMTHALMQLASSCSSDRIILSLEGGYHIRGIAQCVSKVIRALSGDIESRPEEKISLGSIHKGTRNFIERAVPFFSQYWQNL
ncbi:MAG: histone deacetylase [bacterium]